MFNAFPNHCDHQLMDIRTIAFDLPRDERVTISVYDMLGREVLRVAEDHFAAGARSWCVLRQPRSMLALYKYGSMGERGGRRSKLMVGALMG